MKASLIIIAAVFNLFFLILGTNASATVTVEAVSGASGFNLQETTPVIYGGIAGDSSGCSGTSTCDTCINDNATDGPVACNKAQIIASTQLTIRFRSDVEGNGGVAFLLVNDGSTDQVVEQTTATVTKGTSVALTTTWGEICNVVEGGDATCSTAFPARTIKVGVDSDGNNEFADSESRSINVIVAGITSQENDNTIDDCDTEDSSGICRFRAFPGDEKAFIKDAEISGTFPSNDNNADFTQVAFCTSDKGFADITNASCGTTTTVSTDSAENVELNDRTVGGLTNGTKYYFRLAHVDAAGNLLRFTSNSNIGANCNGCTVSTTLGSGCDAETQFTCPYIATPDKVLGILDEDLNCFIATAAFGSSWAPPVKTFRRFRGLMLRNHSWARPLVRQYYRLGPYAARFIHNHPWAKALSQVILWPLWAVASLWLQWGSAVGWILLLLSLSFVLLAVHHTRRRINLL